MLLRICNRTKNIFRLCILFQTGIAAPTAAHLIVIIAAVVKCGAAVLDEVGDLIDRKMAVSVIAFLEKPVLWPR